jgi:hypothetical protein
VVATLHSILLRVVDGELLLLEPATHGIVTETEIEMCAVRRLLSVAMMTVQTGRDEIEIETGTSFLPAIDLV